jgi:hypothetical protein
MAARNKTFIDRSDVQKYNETIKEYLSNMKINADKIDEIRFGSLATQSAVSEALQPTVSSIKDSIGTLGVKVDDSITAALIDIIQAMERLRNTGKKNSDFVKEELDIISTAVNKLGTASDDEDDDDDDIFINHRDTMNRDIDKVAKYLNDNHDEANDDDDTHRDIDIVVKYMEDNHGYTSDEAKEAVYRAFLDVFDAPTALKLPPNMDLLDSTSQRSSVSPNKGILASISDGIREVKEKIKSAASNIDYESAIEALGEKIESLAESILTDNMDDLKKKSQANIKAKKRVKEEMAVESVINPERRRTEKYRKPISDNDSEPEPDDPEPSSFETKLRALSKTRAYKAELKDDGSSSVSRVRRGVPVKNKPRRPLPPIPIPLPPIPEPEAIQSDSNPFRVPPDVNNFITSRRPGGDSDDEEEEGEGEGEGGFEEERIVESKTKRVINVDHIKKQLKAAADAQAAAHAAAANAQAAAGRAAQGSQREKALAAADAAREAAKAQDQAKAAAKAEENAQEAARVAEDEAAKAQGSQREKFKAVAKAAATELAKAEAAAKELAKARAGAAAVTAGGAAAQAQVAAKVAAEAAAQAAAQAAEKAQGGQKIKFKQKKDVSDILRAAVPLKEKDDDEQQKINDERQRQRLSKSLHNMTLVRIKLLVREAYGYTGISFSKKNKDQIIEEAVNHVNWENLYNVVDEAWDNQGGNITVSVDRKGPPRIDVPPSYSYRPSNSSQLTIYGGKLGDLSFDMNKMKRMELLARKGRKKVLQGKIPYDLFHLLTKKYSDKIDYSPSTIERYRKILEMANVPITGGRSMKSKLIHNNGYVKMYSDPHKLFERLQLLIGSIESGNRARELVNEVSEILDELKKHRLISGREMTKILKNIV